MKNFISKVKDTCKKVNLKKAFMAFAFLLTMGMTMVDAVAVPETTAYAATPTPAPLEAQLGLDKVKVGTNVLGEIVNLIGLLARVVGILLGVYGLYKLIVALKDQDANGITQAIVLIAVGIILIAFKTIVKTVFGI